jgi:hypothetical protein
MQTWHVLWLCIKIEEGDSRNIVQDSTTKTIAAASRNIGKQKQHRETGQTSSQEQKTQEWNKKTIAHTAYDSQPLGGGIDLLASK